MAEQNETLTLLEELYADAVAKGHRDDPLIVKLHAHIQKLRPKGP